MIYFYAIGNKVLCSDKEAVRSAMGCPNSERYAMLKFDEDATVSVVEEGDEFEPENK